MPKESPFKQGDFVLVDNPDNQERWLGCVLSAEWHDYNDPDEPGDGIWEFEVHDGSYTHVCYDDQLAHYTAPKQPQPAAEVTK